MIRFTAGLALGVLVGVCAAASWAAFTVARGID